MSPTTDEIDAADELRDAVASLRRLANGENLAEVYPEFTPHNVIGALCLDRGTVAHAWLAANPIDDSAQLTPEWVAAAAGGPQPDAVSEWRVAPTSRLCVCRGGRAGGVWVCWLTDSRGDTVTLPDLTTRGQLRRLLAALAVPAAEGGVS